MADVDANDAAAVEATLRELKPRLTDLDARPHWGKVHTMTGLARRYPRFEEFRALVAAWDPSGRFGNETLDAILG